VVAKNIHAYVEQKGNPNQICWLWHKIIKPANVVSMFRIFLDSDQYSFERILCTEKLFGNDGYVCPGGSIVAKVCEYNVSATSYCLGVEHGRKGGSSSWQQGTGSWIWYG